jgi:hypothetical protein
MDSPSGLLSPSLPSAVQASLLQVGMRVRKSVFDGYRTSPKAFEASQDYCLQSSVAKSPRSRGESNAYFPIYQDKDIVMQDGGFPSSQESMSSTTSSMPPPPSPPRVKRTLDDDGNEEEGHASLPQGNVYTLAERPIHPFFTQNSRKIAKPRSRKFVASSASAMETPDDFEEADFLVYGQ